MHILTSVLINVFQTQKKMRTLSDNTHQLFTLALFKKSHGICFLINLNKSVKDTKVRIIK